MNELEVEKFLLQTPDFFIGRSRLLTHIKIPHETGAISLIEKQLQVLRAHNQRLRLKLKVLSQNAKKNERLFQLLRELVLDALEVTTPGALKACVEGHLKHQFGLLEAELKLAPFLEEQRRRLETLFKRRAFVSGPIHDEDRLLLLPNAPKVRSIAARLIRRDLQWLGILCVGSEQPDYFHPAMESLFLDYLSEVIERVLSFMPAAEIDAHSAEVPRPNDSTSNTTTPHLLDQF